GVPGPTGPLRSLPRTRLRHALACPDGGDERTARQCGEARRRQRPGLWLPGDLARHPRPPSQGYTDMSECPRFGKWLGGCRFEARYDQRTERSDFDRIFGAPATSWIQYE